MSTKEKEIVRAITEAVSALPEGKQEYILGYAEGVIAMADRAQPSEPSDQPSDAQSDA